MYAIGIDLGGTNIAAAVVTHQGSILGRASIPTPNQWGEQLPYLVCQAMVTALFNAIADANCNWNDITHIGIGAPGTINPTTQTIGRWSNMNFLNVPLGQIFKQALSQHKATIPPILLENDANAAALGEFCAGAGANSNSLVAITLGTGVGGGAVFNGKLFTGHNFSGMELGHFVLREGGRLCTCGRRGCFEAYSSATALIECTKEAMQSDKSSILWSLAQNNLDNVNGKLPFDAAETGDPTATNVVNQYITYLASGVVSLINILQPEVLCIGGGVAGQKDKLLAPLQAILDREDYARENQNRCRIALATLGNDAGIIGAALLNQFR